MFYELLSVVGLEYTCLLLGLNVEVVKNVTVEV